MPLSAEGPNRSFRQNVTLAVLLAGVAGAVNAAGFFVLGNHTSHITGHVAAVGEAFAGGRTDVAREAASLLAMFILGAATAAALLDLMSRRRRGRYTPALALEAAVLVGVALGSAQRHAPQPAFMSLALCFAMGLQNALVTRISGAVVRTTHMTGVLTDLGMELVHIFKWFVDRGRSGGVAGVWQALRGLLVAPEFERAFLHLALAFSFLAGATLGPMMVMYWDTAALGLPGVVLLGLVALDWRRPREQRPPSEPLPARDRNKGG